MKIGYKITNLDNNFFYRRKSKARIVVKLDRTTSKVDIAAVGPPPNKKTMVRFARIVNSEFDKKIKLNPNAY